MAAMAPMVNGVDDKAVLMLREEIDKLKATMVSRETHELLQRELRANKEALDSYKKESNKKMLDLMKEVSVDIIAVMTLLRNTSMLYIVVARMPKPLEATPELFAKHSSKINVIFYQNTEHFVD